jgi:two-component system, OmpR family, sensor histidine kinase TctE
MTIRRRLLLLLLPALALLMLGGGVVDYNIAVATTQDALDRALASRALVAAAFLAAQEGAADVSIAARASEFLRAEAADGDHSYAVIGASGAVLSGEPALARLQPVALTATSIIPQSATTAAAATPAALRRAAPLFANATLAGRPVRIARIGIPVSGGIATVTVAETRERRLQTQRVMLFGKLLVDFAELDLTLLLIWFGVYFGLRPLGWLRDQAEAYSLRELQRFEERRVPGELRPLIVAFNRVLELLHEAGRAQRRFVADAAHQMRTPVAGLLAQIELLIGEPRARVVGDELLKLQRAAQSMAHSANQLLALARAEPLSALQAEMKPVALDHLVRELVERHLERADRAGIDLGADTAAVWVRADPWLLEDLLGNLIDNSLKYTPRHGHVTVRCGLDGAWPFLEVEDDGPGIPEGERQRVRERFYRSPGSPGMGAGLGLAIVEEIARVHEATLVIGAGSSGGGARLRVRFAAPAPGRGEPCMPATHGVPATSGAHA